MPDIYKTLKDQEDGLPVLNLQVSSKAQTTTAAPPEEEADTVEKEDNSSNEGQTQVKDEVDDEGSD